MTATRRPRTWLPVAGGLLVAAASLWAVVFLVEGIVWTRTRGGTWVQVLEIGVLALGFLGLAAGGAWAAWRAHRSGRGEADGRAAEVEATRLAFKRASPGVGTTGDPGTRGARPGSS